ncbi:hypothetical protein [Dysgonomonas sp. GY617]|uniref:hypothetical protein n=1 Tax=Dysgonomonas sp. GY617 TaxID=2780420 RepID=UPI001884195D|nr:hypothetical protein [Dysgonomonas sp. GY617]MBF0578190.1 hypothetical protein [Dysgonomonas sp. GY617]
MRETTTKTCQQIYDFCLLDATYNSYYNVPDYFHCTTHQQYKYYHGNLNQRGISRAGNFICHQSRMQLYRFMGVKPNWNADSLRFFLDPETYHIANRADYQYPGLLIYVRCHIIKQGVNIEFSHPFNRLEDVIFISRSHNPYSEEGIRLDVLNYINKKLFIPPGRYRDLQLEHKIYKENFIKWYKKEYLPAVKRQNEWEEYEMKEEYTTQPSEVNWDDCYDMLNMVGAFSDFGADYESERYDMTDQLFEMCTK